MGARAEGGECRDVETSAQRRLCPISRRARAFGQLPKLDVPNAVEDRLPDAEIDAWQGNRRSLTCPPPKSYPPGIVTVTKMQWAFNPGKSDAVIKHVGVGAAAPHERWYPGESLAAIDMRAVLDAADVDHPVVFMCSERDTVIAAARHTPSVELEPQRLGQPVRVGRQGGGDEFGDRSGDLVWKSIECTHRRRRQLHRPRRIPASHLSP